MLSWIDFWSFLPPNLAPKIGPNGAENDKKLVKIPSKFAWLLEPIFEQIWVDVEVENGAMLAPK